MYECLGQVELNTGEVVDAGVVHPPDSAWTEGLVDLYRDFEIGPWHQAFAQILSHEIGAEVRFYVLHRSRTPLASMMTVEDGGVGLRGNVWTRPSERRKRACAGLMALQMRDFRARSGRGLYLFTDYLSVPYRIYSSFGFQGVARGSGHMAYYSLPAEDFEAGYFDPGETDVEAFDWAHVPAAHPLFMGDYPGLVRCAPLGLVGRWSPEWPLVGLLNTESRRLAAREAPRAVALRNLSTGAVAGFATWAHRSRGKGTCVIDVYCHPAYWSSAGDLLDALQTPSASRLLAYADTGCEAKAQFLRRAGFEQVEHLERVPVDWCRPGIGRLPSSRLAALFARSATPPLMALRRLRPRQGGTVNSTSAAMDLNVFERR